MKLRDEDKKWLAEQTSSQVIDAIAAVVDEFKPHGWRRVAYWAREWGLTAAAIATPLTLLGMLIAVGIFAASGITKNATFQTRTEDRLVIIEGDIHSIREGLAKQDVVNHISLPPPEFKATLPDLTSTVAKAQEQKLKIPLKVVNDLSQKLASTDNSAPAFWPAVASVISYRSFLLVGSEQNWQSFPACKEPPTPRLGTVGADGKTDIQRLPGHDCYIELDGKSLAWWDCTHCVVKYSGGTLALMDVNFINCLFVVTFPAQHSPTPSGQRFSDFLLRASKLDDVGIKNL